MALVNNIRGTVHVSSGVGAIPLLSSNARRKRKLMDIKGEGYGWSTQMYYVNSFNAVKVICLNFVESPITNSIVLPE